MLKISSSVQVKCKVSKVYCVFAMLPLSSTIPKGQENHYKNFVFLPRASYPEPNHLRFKACVLCYYNEASFCNYSHGRGLTALLSNLL